MLVASSLFFADKTTTKLRSAFQASNGTSLRGWGGSERPYFKLYSVRPEIPLSIDNILALVAAAVKYGMDEAQSLIRAEVSRRALFLSTPAEIFRV